MVSTLHSQLETETAGTITPSLTKKSTNYSDLSLVLDETQYIEEHKKFFKDLQKYESASLTESEYFTAHSGSGFTTDSAASSSIWK